MAKDVVFTIKTKEAAAIQGFMRLTDAEKKVALETAKTGQALDKKNKSLQDSEINWGRMIKTATGIGSVTAVVGTVIGAVDKLDKHLERIAQKSKERSEAISSFVFLQSNGAAGQEHVRRTMVAGARMGLTMEQTAGLAMPIQSGIDTAIDTAEERRKFETRFKQAATMSRQGVDPAIAAGIINAGAAKGVEAQRMADMVMQAADISEAGVPDIAAAISSMSTYSGAGEFLPILAGLTRTEKNFGRLPTRTMQLSRVLGAGGGGKYEKFYKQMGLKAGMSETEKLAAIRSKAEASGDVDKFVANLYSMGIQEAELGETLGMAIKEQPSIAQFRETIGGVAPGFSEARYARTRAASPETAFAEASKEAAAAREIMSMYSGEAEAARNYEARAQAQGVALMGVTGTSMGIDEETGKPGMIARALIKYLFESGPATQAAQEKQGAQPMQPIEQLTHSVDRLNTTLLKGMSGDPVITTNANNIQRNANK